MSQPFFSDITMRQCHIMTFRTCSPLVLLHLVSYLRFISRPRQFRIQILKLAFAFRFSFICTFYSSIHIWFNTRTTDLCGNIEKKPGHWSSSSQNVSICHWNLNSITEHSYVKISLLKASIHNQKFIISLFINSIQFVCLKHTSIQVFLYMKAIQKYRVMNQSNQTTHCNIKGVVYVSTSKILFHRKY